MEAVIIDWDDSCALDGGIWHDKEAVEELKSHKCRSIGWVVKENKDCVVLVSSTSDHQFSGDICIPKSAIKKRKKLKP
jgi:hypothetical protein